MHVSLLSYTKDPVETIYASIRIMRENVPHTLEELKVSREEMEKQLSWIYAGNIQGAFEFVNFVFLLEDVNRGTTHQLVRHRVGWSYSQQSQRAVNMSNFGYTVPPKIKNNIEALKIYTDSMKDIQTSYNKLVEIVPIEDARGVLPTNVYTNIMTVCTFRALLACAETRLCVKIQEEFQNVVKSMKEEVTKVDSFLGKLIVCKCERTGYCEYFSDSCGKHKKRKVS